MNKAIPFRTDEKKEAKLPSMKPALRFLSFMVLSVFLGSRDVYAEQKLGDQAKRRFGLALMEYGLHLSDVETWQRDIYEHEVVPQAQRFMKDYTPEKDPNFLPARVNEEKLRNYLSFYAPKAMGKSNPTLFVFLQDDRSCKRCQQSASRIRGLTHARFKRRGFQLRWVTPGDLELDRSTNSKKIIARLKSFSESKKGDGFLWVHWNQFRPKTGHQNRSATVTADQVSLGDPLFEMRMVMGITGVDQIFEKRTSFSDPNETFASAQVKLMNRLFVQLARNKLTQGASKEEKTLGKVASIRFQIQGIRDYTQFQRLRSTLREKLQEQGATEVSVEPMVLQRGEVAFLVKASPVLKDPNESSQDRLLQALQALAFDSEQDVGIKIEVKPWFEFPSPDESATEKKSS